MAMAVHGKNRHYRWKEICIRHWLETAKRCGFGEMKTIIQDVIARTPVTIQQVRAVVPVGFPAEIADSILDGISARAEQLKMELEG